MQALRGLAVLLVVLYHAQLPVSGGFIGVDMFFVISGFVIGRRLLDRLWSTPGHLMGEFYLHRARRILPALAVLLVAVILLSPLLAPIGGASKASPTGAAAALFSANLYLYRATAVGYFGAAAELNPLLHTWSLSVEEQFYFVIPVLLLAAWMIGRRRWGSLRLLRLVVCVLLVASLVACVTLSSANGTVLHVNGLRFAFFSPITRAWEFAAGLALVLLPARFLVRTRLRPVLVIAGLAMVGVAAFAYSGTTVFPGYAALLPVVGTALVIHAGTRGDPGPDVPPTPPGLRSMTWLGDVSYSWYLWHWPIIVFVGAFWPQHGAVLLTVAAAASLLPAWLSYRALEQPLRATSASTARSTVVLAIVCIVAPLVAAGLARPVTVWASERAATHLVAADAYPGQAGERQCNSLVPRGARPADACTFGDADAPSRVVLLGDSNAAHLSNALIGVADAGDARVEIVTRGGCPIGVQPFVWPTGKVTENRPDACARFYEASVRAMEADPPDVVVLGNATDSWIFRDGSMPIDPKTGRVPSSVAERARLYEQDLTGIVQRLVDVGILVVLVESIPKPYTFGYTFDIQDCSRLAVIVDTPRCLARPFAVDLDAAPRDGNPDQRANALNRRVAQRTGATTWSFADAICPGGRCAPMRHGRLVWQDNAHLSGVMSESLAPTARMLLRQTLDATPRLRQGAP
ncbi:MAG: acyltransferase family protein [Acidimicrobiia bacterium]